VQVEDGAVELVTFIPLLQPVEAAKSGFFGFTARK